MEQLYKEFNYPSATKFYKILKDNGGIFTLLEVKEFIKKQEVEQLHKQTKKYKKQKLSITANSLNEIFQIDLLDYQKYKTQNRGYCWILIVVDVFSRYAYGIPMKDKTALNCKNAFEEVLKVATPEIIYHDMGNEFKGVFKVLIDSKHIVSFENEFKNHNTLGIIDRFSRTLKTIISKFMTANNTSKWVDELPKIINIYNKSPHSALEDLKPKDIEGNKKNTLFISTLNFDKNIRNKEIRNKRQKYKVGDFVRIKKVKDLFTKGYEMTYSKKIYIIESIEGKKATVDNKEYPLSDLLIVPDNILNIVDTTIKDKADRDERIKRKLRRQGMDDYNNKGLEKA